ncbi:MAG: AraC family transcriptional regulator, partial [Pseudomonadota bacterium]
HQLVTTELSIAEIAYNCGFSSQAHLTTRFSEEFGVTPARYRTQARIDAAAAPR